MPKVTKNMVDADLRTRVFDALFNSHNTADFIKINDRQYGVLITDLNGEERYVRVGAIVAEAREDISAKDLMQTEVDTYLLKQEEKAIKAEEKKRKIAADKIRREAAIKKAQESEI